MQSLHAVTLLVPDYDAGIAFYVHKLGWVLHSDIDLGGGKRWVLVGPNDATKILLARATTDSQISAIGQQTGDRVGFFLQTDNFAGDHAAMLNQGVHFEEEPRHEPYGTVVVWQDPFGNRWDLIEFS